MIGCESGGYREVYLRKLEGEVYEIMVGCAL